MSVPIGFNVVTNQFDKFTSFDYQDPEFTVGAKVRHSTDRAYKGNRRSNKLSYSSLMADDVWDDEDTKVFWWWEINS